MTLAIPEKLNIAEEFIARPAAAHPRRLAIVSGAHEFTYAEVASAVDAAADSLLAGGMAPRERILIVLPDSLEFVAAFFGAAKIGAIAVPVNPAARRADYAHYIEDCAPRLAFVHESALSEFAPAATAHTTMSVRIIRDSETSLWPSGLSAQTPATSAAESFAARAEDPAFILYTSGSGGTPKGALHRHRDMLVTSESFARGVLGIRAEDRCFSVSKLFFAYGLGNGMYFPFFAGASTVLYPLRPRPKEIAEVVALSRPTIFFSVPTFYAALLRECEVGLAPDFSSVRHAVSAGEALPAEIFDRFRKRFGIEILDGIGSTEMLHMFLSSRPGQARAGSCGTPVPNYEAKIVDDAEADVSRGEIGNLWVRGASAFAEYWGKPELTVRTKRGDWVVTGDKFVCDDSGFYHYCGRADDMMKVSGMWVSPGEVENTLLGHPAVAEAAVVSRIDSLGLVHPVAHIVLKADRAAAESLAEEIKKWLRAKLVSYKCPRQIEFLAELPKTATGKIQRFRLRDP
ncbi:MAG: benzoate-CoA ligase family protein [Candidatus Acidiferrales bacterium]